MSAYSSKFHLHALNEAVSRNLAKFSHYRPATKLSETWKYPLKTLTKVLNNTAKTKEGTDGPNWRRHGLRLVFWKLFSLTVFQSLSLLSVNLITGFGINICLSRSCDFEKLKWREGAVFYSFLCLPALSIIHN